MNYKTRQFGVAVALGMLILSVCSSRGQIGYTLHSLEALIANADLVVRGSVAKTEVHRREGEQWLWLDVTLKVKETLKGSETKSVTFAYLILEGDERWAQFIESGQEQLWFLAKSDRNIPGSEDKEIAIRARHPYRSGTAWPWLRLGREVEGERGFSRPPPPIFTMDFQLLTETAEILKATHSAVEAEPKERPNFHSIMIPRQLANRTGSSGDANAFTVPADHRLEALGILLIESPETILEDGNEKKKLPVEQEKLARTWREFSADLLRAEGVQALRQFKSEENIARLKTLLDHPALVGRSDKETREYFVRKAAFEMLTQWEIPVEQPVLEE